jgi:8-oxo-dGTP pyrophosphatase MutT (NUDIX family)
MDFKINVTVFIFKDNRVLLAKRSMEEENWPGWYVGPGGNYEPTDPSLEATVAREAKEEVGLVIFNIKFIKSRTGDNKDRIFLYFTAETTGEAQALEDTDKIIWVSLDELDKHPKIMAENLKVLKS